MTESDLDFLRGLDDQFACEALRRALGYTQGKVRRLAPFLTGLLRPLRIAHGDWVCPRCGAKVFAVKAACYKCNAPRPGGGSDGAHGDTAPPTARHGNP